MAASIIRVLVATSRSADDRKTLAAVRALAGRGVEVTLGSGSDRCLPRRSRSCSRFLEYPDPGEDAGAFVAALAGFLGEHPQDSILPLCDYTTQALVEHGDRIAASTGLCVPGREPMARACDKARLLELADRLGIGIPRTWCIRDEHQLREAARSVSYPCVLKLRRSAGGVGRYFLDTPEALRRAYASLPAQRDAVFDSARPLVQEYVPGEIHDACALFRRGEPRALLTQKRLAMHPAEGGVGIYNETTRDPELGEQAVALLRALEWHGPAQVEFKRDARDGRLRLMEVNARFWGTLGLAIQAGVDFPYLTTALAVHGEVEPVFDYRVGQRYRWTYWYGSPEQPVGGLQLRALLDALLPTKRRATDLWLSDPGPHLAAAWGSGRAAFERLLSGEPRHRPDAREARTRGSALDP